ncbi:MAG: aminotransferase class V-fold PLP-dependent enzyme [Rhodothermales bacterium]|nr:aminotransferase class V-fold PLP-dependent enzyme [Rhodothermales bacterium]
MAPIPRRVERAGIEAIARKRAPAAVTPDDFFRDGEALRSEFADLIHAEDPARVAIIPAASYGLATAARNLPVSRGQRIVTLREQFPSNVYTWTRLAADKGALVTHVEPIAGPDRGRRWNERILEAIDRNTAVVALPHVHWADGTLFDLEAIGRRARDVGAALVIDGTQSVGALPFDVQRIQPDAVICAGYKWLLGPYSIGLAWFGNRFDNGVPLEENWISRRDSHDFAGLVRYRDEYGPGAARYDVGERSNFILVPMLLEALRLLNGWGPEAIQAYCRTISQAIIPAATELGFEVEEAAWRGDHLFGLRLPRGMDPAQLKQAFDARNISVSVRGDAIRISPNVYNATRDAEALVEGLVSHARALA